MLAVLVTIGLIITLPFMIPWYIWMFVMWVYLKHKYGFYRANLFMRAWVDSIDNNAFLLELIRFVVWPYGIIQRTRSIISFFKEHCEWEAA